jgi:hypothetical protein
MTDGRLCEHSPLRIFERATAGGLGRGHVGVVLSRHGVGKTAFLIGVAIDALLQERQVLHISTKESVERVRQFYDQVFYHLVASLAPHERARCHLEMERNRHILVYNRKTFSLAKLEESVAFLREGAGFAPSLVIMDGTPRFEKTEPWEMEGLVRLAEQWQAEIWTSSNTHREGQELDAQGIPTTVARYAASLPLILYLEPSADHVRVRILRDRDRADVADLQLELDPATGLLRWY